MNPPNNPSCQNSSAVKGKATWFNPLLGVVLSVLFSGCAGIPKTNVSPEARDTFLSRFHEIAMEAPSGRATERAKEILGPALQFPTTYPKLMGSGNLRSYKETINSLYWMRSRPKDFIEGNELELLGLAVADPDYARTYASKVPDKFKCKDDDESRIAFAKAYLTKQGLGSSFTPQTHFKLYQSGLKFARGTMTKPIGSSMVKVSFRPPAMREMMDKITDASHFTFVFEKIPGDSEGRVILVGWASDRTDFW